MSEYLSPYTGPLVDSAVDLIVNGLTQQTSTATTISLGLSGGKSYVYTNPVTAITISSYTNNSVGDIIRFTAGADNINPSFPAGMAILWNDDIVSGHLYDLMVCDGRIIIKEVERITTA